MNVEGIQGSTCNTTSFDLGVLEYVDTITVDESMARVWYVTQTASLGAWCKLPIMGRPGGPGGKLESCRLRNQRYKGANRLTTNRTVGDNMAIVTWLKRPVNRDSRHEGRRCLSEDAIQGDDGACLELPVPHPMRDFDTSRSLNLSGAVRGPSFVTANDSVWGYWVNTSVPR